MDWVKKFQIKKINNIILYLKYWPYKKKISHTKKQNEDLMKNLTSLKRDLNKFPTIVYGSNEGEQNQIDDDQTFLKLVQDTFEIEYNINSLWSLRRIGKQNKQT